MSHAYGLHRPSNSSSTAGKSTKGSTPSSSNTGAAAAANANLGSGSSYGSTNKNTRVYAGTPNYSSSRSGSNTSSLTRYGTTPGSTADIYKPTQNSVTSRIPTSGVTASSTSGGYTSDFGAGKTGYTSDYGSKGHLHYGSSSNYLTSSNILPENTGKGSGYTSDYGRSGYASDFTKKTGYTSDRGRSGYVSSGGHTPAPKQSKYASQYAAARQDITSSRSPSISSTGNRSTSGGNYGVGTFTRSVSREDTTPKYRTSIPSNTGASYNAATKPTTPTSKTTATGSNAKAPLTSPKYNNYIKSNYNSSRPTTSTKASTYSRPQSFSYPATARAANYTPKKPNENASNKNNQSAPLSKSESKAKNVGKAPADFTSDSESDSESEETDSESPNEDGGGYVLVSRGTSPSPEIKPKTASSSGESEEISATIKIKCPEKVPKVLPPCRSSGIQVNAKELEKRTAIVPTETTVTSPSTSTSSTPRRYGIGHPSRPSSIYFDKYYSKYAPGSSTSTRSYYSGRSPTSPTASSRFITSPKSETRKDQDSTSNNIDALRSPITPEALVSSSPAVSPSKKQIYLTVDGMDRGSFSRDVSPNAGGLGGNESEVNTADESGVKKDYRKSILNMNLDERGMEEYQRRQEEMRASERRTRKSEANHHKGHRKNSVSSLEDGDSTLTRSSSKKKMLDLNRTTSKSRMVNDHDVRKSGSRTSLHKSNSHSKVSPTDETVVVLRRRRGSRDEISSRSSSADLLENNRRDSSTSSEEDCSEKVRLRPRRRRKGSKEDVLGATEDKTSPGHAVRANLSLPNTQGLGNNTSSKPPASPSLLRRESFNLLTTETETSCDECEAEEAEVPPVRLGFSKFPSSGIVPEQPDAETSALESSDDSDASNLSHGGGVTLLKPTGNGHQQVQKSATVIHVQETPTGARKETSSSSEETSEDEEVTTERTIDKDGTKTITDTKEDATNVSDGKGTFVKEASPRDSGFSEPLPTPTEDCLDDDKEEALKQQEPEVEKEGESSEIPPVSKRRTSKTTERFIGNCRDIDSILNDGEKTFEELEVEFQKEQDLPKTKSATANAAPITVIPATSGEEESDEEEKPVVKNEKDKARQHLTLFIGKCKDIDEMLGTVSPSSPRFGFPTGPIEDDDDDPLGLKKIEQKMEEDEAVSSEGEGDSTASSAVEEVEASDVRVHEAAKLLKSKVEEYTEEIDSSAVRIRESKAMNPELQQCTEEIDSERVRIREAPKMKGQILKSPKVMVSTFLIILYNLEKI